jgi:hypothetical protein
MESLIKCVHKGKNGYKCSVNGKCYTYNQNIKSQLKAKEYALNELKINHGT